jgi:NADH-quinone oxidoreductase subunit A
VVAWISVFIFLFLIAGFIVSALIFSRLISPRRTGPTKDMPYESGVPPVGEARNRIHVRFYLIGLVFLLFDVELVFFYPWAKIFGGAEVNPSERKLLLVGMGLFILLLILAYVYAWAKGVFRWRDE